MRGGFAIMPHMPAPVIGKLGATSMLSRIFDYFKLKPRVQSEISNFVFIGIILGIFPSFSLIAFVTKEFGLSPEMNLHQVENGGLIMTGLILLLIATMMFFILLGAIIHAVFLTLTGKMKFWEAWDATVLSKYPHHWFK
ncbi:hypothetical protein Q4561_19720 [Alteromonas sp. 1_MG-2023]|uniref:hypothetical protein n=1 Tax=Alteromonas sp. 1_MG-2023 TaxID=3062669 RepID=UPI0026E139E4|nr:hypothetical protein [Alteromonas sp. 1_MG-2023]MDO6569297.1 hypothetical protein [Alteromonas sp. 1_MG-2023]